MSSVHPSDFIESEFSTSYLEDLFNGQQDSPEVKSLIHTKHKYFTVVPKPFMLFGAYNKINYTSFCYNACLMTNGEQEPKAKRLLCFGGGFSRLGSCLANLLILILFLLPFSAIWPTIIEPPLKNDDKNHIYVLTILTSVEFLLFLWHFYCIYIIKFKNLQVWLNSWFTCCVKSETLQGEETDSATAHSFFFMRGKLQVIDISVSDLCRLTSVLHQLTATKREELASVVENHRLEQAVIILYSEEFVSTFLRFPMYGVFILAVLSAASTAFLTWKTCIIWLHH